MAATVDARLVEQGLAQLVRRVVAGLFSVGAADRSARPACTVGSRSSTGEGGAVGAGAVGGVFGIALITSAMSRTFGLG